MRPSEYLALKWSDIDWHRGAVSVCRTIQVSPSGWTFDDTKRKRSRRIVKLQEFVAKALENLRAAQKQLMSDNCQTEHDLIFRTAAGSPLRQRTVKREFQRILEMAGIRRIRLYDLRHTAATLAVAAGVSVKVISDQLGTRAFRSRWSAIRTYFRAFRTRRPPESSACSSDRLETQFRKRTYE